MSAFRFRAKRLKNLIQSIVRIVGRVLGVRTSDTRTTQSQLAKVIPIEPYLRRAHAVYEIRKPSTIWTDWRRG